MKNKKLLTLLSVGVIAPAMFVFAACTPQHKFSEDWDSDSTSHWHTCQDEGCTEVVDKADHSFGSRSTKTAAGVHQDEIQKRTCTECDYEDTQEITGTSTHQFEGVEWAKDASGHWHVCGYSGCTATDTLNAHVFGSWSTKTVAGVHQNQVQKRNCIECGYEDTREVDNSALHSFSTEWSSDASQHWHQSTCAHDTPLKSDIGAHVYADDDATTCSTCGAPRTAVANSVTVTTLASKTYDGQPYQLSADAYSATHGTPVVTYQYKGTTEWVTTAPTDAGVHKVKISVAATAAYSAAEKIETFEIKPKYLSLIWLLKEYDGTPYFPTTTLTSTGDNRAEGLVGDDTVTISGVEVDGVDRRAQAYTPKTGWSLSNSNYKISASNIACGINVKYLKGFTVSARLSDVKNNLVDGKYTITLTGSQGIVEGETVQIAVTIPNTITAGTYHLDANTDEGGLETELIHDDAGDYYNYSLCIIDNDHTFNGYFEIIDDTQE